MNSENGKPLLRAMRLTVTTVFEREDGGVLVGALIHVP
jgi:hypothetical protein